MAAQHRYDFVVIGAGIAGGSAAFHLAGSAHVCVLEAEASPALHATGRSAALFAPSYGGTEVRALTRASHRFFLRPPAGFADHPLLDPRRVLYISRGDQKVRLEQMIGDVRRSGGQIGMISKADALEAIPLLRRDYIAAAAEDLDATAIDVDALQQGFLRGARAAGATVMTNAAPLAIRRQAGLWSVQLAGGTIEAPVLINAAGAWADQVAALCGARAIGLQPLRRTALLVDPPAGIDVRRWPAVIDVDEQFYFKPDAGKLLISPADETPQGPGDAQPDEMDVAIGVDRVQQALDIEVRRVTHSWAGLRTFASDRAPVIGFDPGVEGLFWSAGQGGYGIQTAPAWGRTVAALARGEAVPEDIVAEGLNVDAIAPGRFFEAEARRSVV